MRFLVFTIMAIAVVCGENGEKVCTPGETQMEDCNSCFCLSDGSGWGCTLMACPPKVCEPGKQRKNYCNTCTCAMDGSSEICTRMECPKGVYNADGSLIHTDQHVGDATLKQKRQVSNDQPCVPGRSFKIDCNTCTCGSDGFSVACTKIGCLPPNIFNEDGSLRNPRSVEPLPLARSRRFLRL